MTEVSVLVVDDDERMRKLIVEIVSADRGAAVVGEARNGEEAVSFVRRTAVSVVLMDLRMPVMDGIAATEIIRSQHPGTAVLVLTSFDTEAEIVASMAAGACGYLLKSATREQMSRAVQLASSGHTVLSPKATDTLRGRLTRRLPAEAGADGLTERERDVTVQVCAGLSYREIAQCLSLTVATVKTYVSRILTKTGCRSRSELAVVARERGLNRLPPC